MVSLFSAARLEAALFLVSLVVILSARAQGQGWGTGSSSSGHWNTLSNRVIQYIWKMPRIIYLNFHGNNWRGLFISCMFILFTVNFSFHTEL